MNELYEDKDRIFALTVVQKTILINNASGILLVSLQKTPDKFRSKKMDIVSFRGSKRCGNREKFSLLAMMDH